ELEGYTRAKADGGGRGIRTPDTLSGTTVFKTAAINHSAIPPRKSLSRNFFGAVHVRAQGGRNSDRTVLLLVILQDGDERPADRESGSVQGVDEIRPAATLRTELDVRAPRLERLGVAARRNLAIRLLAWQPHLEVVRL